LLLEAHGTGTALGDPIEVSAAGRVFCADHTFVQCTSMKAHIGHAEAAAAGFGMFSMLNVGLSVGVTGPNVQLRRLNPHL